MTVLRVGLEVVVCIALPAVAATAIVYALCDWVTRRDQRHHEARLASVGEEAESWVHALYYEEHPT